MPTPPLGELTFATLPEALTGWEIRCQYTFIAPPQPTVRVGGQEAAPPPRTNLVVSQAAKGRSSGATAREHLDEFLRQTQPNVPGIQSGTPEDFEFADGKAGCSVEIEFPMTPSQSLLQWHAFRVDDETVTQFVVTRDRDLDDDPDFELAIATAYRFAVRAER